MDVSQSPARSIATSRLLLALGAFSTVSPALHAAQDPIAQTNPMEVTSDTPQYCLHLLDRVSELVRQTKAPAPREVNDLTTEGHRMCTHGHTRGGIMRLRSALMILEKDRRAEKR